LGTGRLSKSPVSCMGHQLTRELDTWAKRDLAQLPWVEAMASVPVTAKIAQQLQALRPPGSASNEVAVASRDGEIRSASLFYKKIGT